MVTVNDPEYWLLIGIIVLLATLAFVIRKNMTREINPKIISAIGLSFVVFGTMVYLIFGVFIFILSEISTNCAFSEIGTNPVIDNKRLLECVTSVSEPKWNLLYGSMIATLFIVVGNILSFIRRN